MAERGILQPALDPTRRLRRVRALRTALWLLPQVRPGHGTSGRLRAKVQRLLRVPGQRGLPARLRRISSHPAPLPLLLTTTWRLNSDTNPDGALGPVWRTATDDARRCWQRGPGGGTR